MTMTIQILQLRTQSRDLAREAQVSAAAMTALLMGLLLVLNQVVDLALTLSPQGFLGVFLERLGVLLSLVLQAGFLLYCMAVYRGELAEYPLLFDAVPFAGKLILLYLLEGLLVYLWSLLFLIPGAIAFYRYRFAVYNLCEDPEISAVEALRRSRLQTAGHKLELFCMDLTFAPWALVGQLPYLYSVYLLLTDQPLPLPDGVMTLLCNLFLGVVDLFWLARHKLSMLGCLEVCKADSGVGAGMGRPGGPLPLR